MTTMFGTEDAETGRLRIVLAGGVAEDGGVPVDQYIASLAGWQQFFQTAGDLYVRGLVPDLEHDAQAFEIRIEGQRQGSLETLLIFVLGAAVGGVISNRADAAVVWTCRRLWAWYGKVYDNHLRTKRSTTNIDEIAANLERLMEEEGLAVPTFEPPAAPAIDDASPNAAGSTEPGEPSPATPPLRAAVETIDQSLETATAPLDEVCETIQLVPEQGHILVAITRRERRIIVTPLTLPATEHDWEAARVRFVRLNRKTGNAIFEFENRRGASHYARIRDPAITARRNPYTRAFNEDQPLEVWVRQYQAEGTETPRWEIRKDAPTYGPLFTGEPED